MARTNLPTTALLANNGINAPAGTAIDQANGMNVALASGAIPAASSADRVVLYVNNTFAGTKVVTIRAGATQPPAMRAGIGDLNYTAQASGASYLGPFEVGRFVQSDGSLNIDFAAGITGTIAALLVPRSI